MIKNLVIMGIDPGMRSMGIARITCSGSEVHADAVQVVKTEVNRKLRAADDQARRLRMIYDALRAVSGLATVDILAYEYYQPFQEAGDSHRARNGSLVAKAEGLAVGYGLAIGAALVPVGPREAKRALGVHSKAEASEALEGKVRGLTKLLDASGRAGHHGSDAVAVAYCGMMKAFSAALKRS